MVLVCTRSAVQEAVHAASSHHLLWIAKSQMHTLVQTLPSANHFLLHTCTLSVQLSPRSAP